MTHDSVCAEKGSLLEKRATSSPARARSYFVFLRRAQQSDRLKSVVEEGHIQQKEVQAMGLKGSRTEKNLLAAFAGESQARTRYTFFASVAKKEGYEQISAIFQETADNEKEHAELFFKLLKAGMVEITAAYPAGVIGSTKENLKEAADGEKLEWGTLYPDFAEVAEKEGFKEAASTFRMVAMVENYHERRYRKFLANIEQGKVFKKDSPVKWKCRNCGYVFEGSEVPDKCPVCAHAKSYFEVWCENY
jgi:rubrerythrin